MSPEVARARKSLRRHFLLFLISAVVTVVLVGLVVHAAPVISVDMTPDPDAGQGMDILEVMLLFAVLALLPSILLMMTCFTRIVIVLSSLRNAMGTQQSPPNTVLIGLALFLTLFIMSPVITEIATTAYAPYKAGQMDGMEAAQAAVKPLKRFMLLQTKPKELNLYLSISGTEITVEEDQDELEELSKLPLTVIVPAFITSELERAFLMGFLLYLPFLVIDMVVSSILMSMGMVMLPPAMISMPFKLLTFILVGGWDLLLGTLVQGFRTI